MAQRTFRTGLLAGALALALLAAGCGDSKESSDGSSNGGGDSVTSTTGGNNDELATTDCGELEYDKDAPSGPLCQTWDCLSQERVPCSRARTEIEGNVWKYR